MKTIETKPGVTLGFVRVESSWFDFRIRYEDKYFILFGRDKSDPYWFQPNPDEVVYDEKILIPEILELRRSEEFKMLNIIGKLSEITEEQARELVEVKEREFYQIHGVDFPLTHLKKLSWITDTLGIKEEDFDKYLVIKL